MNHSWGYGSDQRLRNENQDCHGVFSFPGFTLAIVCDGMGGHVGGAQAAALAVRAVHDFLAGCKEDLQVAIERSIVHANQAIYDAARKDHRLMGMGTTIVVAACTDTHCHIAHVGDSRAYMLRDNEVQLLTRDHTMVNLFVDAELLTPEDAATHPEAHVLSRSLGVERQVDVDVATPIATQANDAFFLCSDGIHGVVNDWEFANVDWREPDDAVTHVLGIVEAREGDDNATAVVLRNGPSTRKLRPTPLPDLQALDHGAETGTNPNALAASPAMTRPRNHEPEIDEPDDPSTESAKQGLEAPAARNTVSETPKNSGYVIYDDDGIQGAAPEINRTSTRRKAEARGAKKRRKNRPVLLIAGTAGIAVAACLGLVVLSLPTPVPEAVSEVALLNVTAPAGMEPEQPLPTVEPLPSEYEPSTMLFAPVLPVGPRRLPKRPQVYTQPPPGGSTQWAAVQAARNRDCAKALDVVRNGMLVSVDHAPLYDSAWKCFNDTHQRMLAQAEVERPEDFGFLVHHFEGPALEREKRESDDIKALPLWYRPAVGGIEYRLEGWSRSSSDDLMSEVVSDLIGESTIADHIARDLLMEAEAAAGLSRVEDPDAKVINWWARRVYVTTRAMHGRPGRLLEQHRPDVIPRIRASLAEATRPRATEDIPVEGAALDALEGTDLGAAAMDTERLWDASGLPRAVALAQAAALGAKMSFSLNPDEDEGDAEKASPPAAKNKAVVRAQSKPALPATPIEAKVYRLDAPVIRSEH